MEQRLSVITLGVKDLPAMRQFYTQQLGWQPVASNREIVFFKLNGLLLSLYGSSQLADFLGLSPSEDQSGFRGFTLAYNVLSSGEVLTLHRTLQEKGVKIIKEPFAAPFGGMMFYFADPEGNVWEVAFNPYVPMDEKGHVITHNPIEHL